MLFQKEKQSIWSLKGLTWKWHGFIDPWLELSLIRQENWFFLVFVFSFVTLGLRFHFFQS